MEVYDLHVNRGVYDRGILDTKGKAHLIAALVANQDDE